jgi:hypothetical protein
MKRVQGMMGISATMTLYVPNHDVIAMNPVFSLEGLEDSFADLVTDEAMVVHTAMQAYASCVSLIGES